MLNDADGVCIPTEVLTRGRCLFCEERCEANAFWHEYCREAHEREEGLDQPRAPDREDRP